jgi:4-hydroxy-tetrahydrodipicolinate synthase
MEGSMHLPRGGYSPAPTPVDNQLRFDRSAQKAHLRWLAGQGLDGALVLGTNGEFPSFSLNERRTVAEAAAEAGSGLRLMLGVGSCALPEVLSLAEKAAESGFESILCPPPFFFRSAPVEGVAAFFRDLLDLAALPVLLYHIPQVTGVPISDALLDRLQPHERLVGVKDSSGDPNELRRLTARFSDGAYLVGNDRLVTQCLSAGGSGSITAAASVAPALVMDVQRGEEAQGKLDAVRVLLEEYGLGPSVKSILRRCGLGAFATRPPLTGLDPDREQPLWDSYCELVPEEHRPRR